MTEGDRRDEDLASRLDELLDAKHPVAAAALATASGTSLASRGADLDADYELASISKAITGLLYADAMERGEVEPESTLGELLPLDGSPADEVTLSSLATHRSGLPRLPKASHPWRRTIELWRRGTNPYREDLPQLLEHAREVPVGRPRPRYSNLGFELLGHTVASAAGTTYADLVHTRLAVPLELDGLYVPSAETDLRPAAVAGTSRRARPRQPWVSEALGPAGGIRATITDMASLTAALPDGSAPGVAALDPIEPMGRGASIGAGWVTIHVEDRAITWHNGGSGGFRSWIGLDRAADAGAIILSATSRSVDREGFQMLTDYVSRHDQP